MSTYWGKIEIRLARHALKVELMVRHVDFLPLRRGIFCVKFLYLGFGFGVLCFSIPIMPLFTFDYQAAKCHFLTGEYHIDFAFL